MAETYQHQRPEAPPAVEREPPLDWELIDRLIILMSLSLAKRLLRKSKRLPTFLKARIEDRIEILIDEYRRPPKRGFDDPGDDLNEGW